MSNNLLNNAVVQAAAGRGRGSVSRANIRDVAQPSFGATTMSNMVAASGRSNQALSAQPFIEPVQQPAAGAQAPVIDQLFLTPGAPRGLDSATGGIATPPLAGRVSMASVASVMGTADARGVPSTTLQVQYAQSNSVSTVPQSGRNSSLDGGSSN